MKTVFALDSSGKAAGVCLLRDGQVLYEKTLNAGRTHSETLLPLAIQAFEAVGLVPGDVDLFAVTGGPGSFTGLRIGMSLLKGLALPSGARAVAVSTLRALAAAHLPGVVEKIVGWNPAAAAGLVPRYGTVVPALDARRSEVYWAAFACGEGLSRLHGDTAGPVGEMDVVLAALPGPVTIVGDGADLCYNILGYEHIAPPPGARPPAIAAGAAFEALRMAEEGAAQNAADLRPVYLRLSQAERERKARLESGAGS